MTFAYGPWTDDLGQKLTTASDGAGGIVLTCPKYGSMTVTAAQLGNTLTAELVRRVTEAEDFYISWRNLSVQIGLGDPGDPEPPAT